MQSFTKFLSVATIAFVLSTTISACQPEDAQTVKPDEEQLTSLNQLHKNCIAASPGKQGRLKNLAVLRKRNLYFTCDEMKQHCEDNYASKMCEGTMIVASVENAYQKACRYSPRAAGSSACLRLSPCNVKGFASPECASAIARYNN